VLPDLTGPNFTRIYIVGPPFSPSNKIFKGWRKPADFPANNRNKFRIRPINLKTAKQKKKKTKKALGPGCPPPLRRVADEGDRIDLPICFGAESRDVAHFGPSAMAAVEVR